jgi:hypothetical protein
MEQRADPEHMHAGHRIVPADSSPASRIDRTPRSVRVCGDRVTIVVLIGPAALEINVGRCMVGG